MEKIILKWIKRDVNIPKNQKYIQGDWYWLKYGQNKWSVINWHNPFLTGSWEIYYNEEVFYKKTKEGIEKFIIEKIKSGEVKYDNKN